VWCRAAPGARRRPIFRIAYAEQASLVADGELLWKIEDKVLPNTRRQECIEIFVGYYWNPLIYIAQSQDSPNQCIP